MKKYLVMFACLILSAGFQAQAQTEGVPSLISYQGRLTNNDGTPMTGSVNLTFNIYDAATAGNQIWGPQTFPSVVLDAAGQFNVILGPADEYPTPRALTGAFGGNDRYLEITVGSTTLTPRQRFYSVPYAMFAPGTRIDDPPYLSVNPNDSQHVLMGVNEDGTPASVNVGIGKVPESGFRLDVAGAINTTTINTTTIQFTADNSTLTSASQLSGFKLLAASTDIQIEQVKYEITATGITLASVAPGPFNDLHPIYTEQWPAGGVFTQILFEVRNSNPTDESSSSFCIGGTKDYAGSAAYNHGNCTRYNTLAVGTVGANPYNENDWIRLTITETVGESPEARQLATCPHSIPAYNAYVADYPGRDVLNNTWAAVFCLYAPSPEDVVPTSFDYTWKFPITKIVVEEVDWSAGDGTWEWKIWYR